MTPDSSAIQTYFAKLGLETEIADIYLSLHANGPQTMSELARSSGVERTRIYRLIDQLMSSGLIEVETHSARAILKAAPIANLRILISKREQELQGLQDELQMVEQILGRNSLSSPASRVQFYHGSAGIKQMFWNETKASSEVCGILYENMQINTGDRFFERWVAACNDRDLHFRGIVGREFTDSQTAWYGTQTTAVRLKHWESKLVDPAMFAIRHSTIIYDTVVATYVWKDGEIFGIETYNQEIAASQRSLFELLWSSLLPEVATDTA